MCATAGSTKATGVATTEPQSDMTFASWGTDAPIAAGRERYKNWLNFIFKLNQNVIGQISICNETKTRGVR